MSEDLDSFFAKRKTKAAKKKAIKLDDVAQRLESNLRMEDPEEFDEVPRPKTIDVSKLQEEDPEWIAFDTKPTLPFETVGVFNYTEQAEQQATAEERQQKSEEKAKTWKKNEPEVKEESPAPVVAPVVTQPVPRSQPAAYRPPGARSGNDAPLRRPAAKVDIQNEEMFPSIGAAEQLEKDEKVKVDEQRRQPSETPPAPAATQQAPKAWQTKPAWQPQAPEEPSKPQAWKPRTQEQRQEGSAVTVEPKQPEVEREVPANHPFLPSAITGNRDGERPKPQARQEGGHRGTGMFNARGEEIMLPDEPTPPPQSQVVENAWRRGEKEAASDQPPENIWRRGEVVSETAPVQHQRNEGGGWRRDGGHRDGGYHRERDSQNEGPWRRDSNEPQHHRDSHHERRRGDGDQHRRDNHPRRNEAPHRDNQPPKSPPVEQPAEENWRLVSHDESADVEGTSPAGESWQTVQRATKERKGPKEDGRRNTGGRYVPPNRR